MRHLQYRSPATQASPDRLHLGHLSLVLTTIALLAIPFISYGVTTRRLRGIEANLIFDCLMALELVAIAFAIAAVCRPRQRLMGLAAILCGLLALAGIPMFMYA